MLLWAQHFTRLIKLPVVSVCIRRAEELQAQKGYLVNTSTPHSTRAMGGGGGVNTPLMERVADLFTGNIFSRDSGSCHCHAQSTLSRSYSRQTILDFDARCLRGK